MIQIYVRASPHRCPRKPRIWETRLWLCRQANIFCRVCGQICPVDPEAEEGIGIRVGVIDKDLSYVDVTDQSLVVRR